MSKWIEEKWLNKRIKDSYRERIGLDSAPSIDIVRCSECKWNDGKGHCKLRYGSLGVFEDVSCDDYCSYGERKGE